MSTDPIRVAAALERPAGPLGHRGDGIAQRGGEAAAIGDELRTALRRHAIEEVYELMDAIEAGDAEAAVRISRAHLDDMAAALRR